MATPESKLEAALRSSLDALADEEEIDVLVHPTRMGAPIERFLAEAKRAGQVDYNVLKLAGCIAVQAPKRLILQIAERDDVARLSANPRFTAG